MMPLENITFPNGTLVNEDYFYSDPIDEEIYKTEANQVFYYTVYVTFEILKLLIYISCIISDIYLVVIMSKFKKLRNRINNLILIYVIFNLSGLILPLFVIFIVELFSSVRLLCFCLLNNFDHLTATLCFYTLTFLAFDWYVLNYHTDIYHKYRKTFKYGIASALLVIAILEWVSTSVICRTDYLIVEDVRFTAEFASFVFCAIVVVCIGIFKRIRKPTSDTTKTEYAFSITKIVFLLSFGMYFARLFDFLTYKQFSSKSILGVCWHMVDCLIECMYLTTPIVTVYLLGKINKHFKMAQLKCCKKNVQEYEDDDLDSGSINESVESPVTFDKNSEEIHF